MDIETADARPRSPVAVTVTARTHAIVQDKPRSSGGQDEGPMASELLLAGLLACQHSTFFKVAAKRKLAAVVTGIHGALEFRDGDIVAIRVRFTIAADAAVADKDVLTCLRLTDKTCTISRVLKVPVEATFERA